MFPTTQNSATSLAAALQESKVHETHAGNGSKAFLKFDFKTGDYFFGRDAEEVTGETIAVNTYSIQHGWTLWAAGKPTKRLAPFNQELPQPMESVGNDMPSESRAFEARFTDDEETILVFETNSFGGRKGVDAILNAVKARAVSGETDYLFPVVELKSENYKSKQGSTIHNPVFEIVGWMDANGEQEGNTKAVEHQEEPEEEKTPVRRRRRSA